MVLQINDARALYSRARGRKFGFGASSVFIPKVRLTHAVFSPSSAEIDHASTVVVRPLRAEAKDSASIQLDGYFIDYPIVYKASVFWHWRPCWAPSTNLPIMSDI